MRYKDFEIQPTTYLDGHHEPRNFQVVKWYNHEPYEVTDWETDEKKMSTRSCYAIANIRWNEKEPCWEFKSYGLRFLENYEEGLNKFILMWLEMFDHCNKEEDEDA